MLSGAKHLSSPRARPFAEFTLERSEGLRVTRITKAGRVMLSGAKHLSALRTRPFAEFTLE